MPEISRRKLLAAGGAISFALPALSAAPAWAGRHPAASLLPPSRSIRFNQLHTGEKLTVDYAINGRYVRDALSEANRILRDWRTDDVTSMDPLLLDQIWLVHEALDTSASVGIISGYRSPRTNAMLANRSNGVAKRSLHMQGRAIDIRIDGRSVGQVAAAAQKLALGGVGRYSRSNFVHLDTGRPRRWGH